MRIEVSKNELAGALVALGKLICRTSPNPIYKVVQIEAKSNDITFIDSVGSDFMKKHCLWLKMRG